MLPNWLFTQSVVEHELSWLAAEHAGPSGRLAPPVLARLRDSPVRTALLPAGLGGQGQQWEQTGRGISALGAVCPATAWVVHEHLAALYQLARATGGGPVLVDAVRAGMLLVQRDAEVVALGEPVVVQWPDVSAPTVRVLATLDGTPAGDPPVPALSAHGYVVRAALASVAINGVGTDLLRRLAKDGSAPPGPLGAAVAALLTSQAATFRGLSMLDALTASGQDCGGVISAAFHTTVRGGVRALLAAVDVLLDQSAGPDREPFGRLAGVLRAMARHPVLGGEGWDEAVAASLSGDWTRFNASW